MTDTLQLALDSLADGTAADWIALEAQTPEALRPTLRALREISSISRAHAVPTRSAPESVPFKWGFLDVEEYLARGAHGDVYRAWDPRLERRVALKLLGHDTADDRSSLAVTEGRLLARVRHPNVVTVHGADRVDGQPGIWMELIEGRNLREIVEDQGPIPVAEAVTIGQAVCDGLAAIHDARLIHRDVKAQNVIRDPAGRITLMDLGGGRDDRRPDDRFEGTPVYLAPELLRGAPATQASDIYAAGVLLFFIVTGRYPVAGPSLADLRADHEAARRERLGSIRSLPSSFTTVVDRALSADPEERFASAAEMRAALQPNRRSPRRPFTAKLLLVAGLGMGLGLGPMWLISRRAGPARVDGAASNKPASTDASAAAASQPVTTSVAVEAGPSTLSVPVGQPPDAAVAADRPRPNRLRLPLYDMGVPSHDGRFFPFVDWNGDVWMWETSSGRSNRLTREGALTEGARNSLASPHGERVVYGWALSDGSYELRVIATGGRWPETVIGRQTAYEPIPLDWSRDGGTILCWLRQKNETADLALVAAEGGSPPRVLATFQATDVTNEMDALSAASLSPDARFVVTTRRTTGEPARHDLVILATDGSELRPLIAGVSDEAFPAWTSDGRQVVFVRDSKDLPTARDAWVVPVVDGVAQTDGGVAARNIGASSRVAVVDDAALFVVVTSGWGEVFTASVDFTRDTAPGAAARISREEVGNHSGPSWSPDGRSIAYFTTRPRSSPGTTPLRTLTILDLQSMRTHSVPPLGFQGGYSPRWFPDNRSVVVWAGADFGVRVGYYRIDVATDQKSALLLFDKGSFPPFPGFFQISADGRDLFYADRRGIVARNLQSGLESIIVTGRAHRDLGRFSLSPDGQSVAFAASLVEDGLNVATIEIQAIGGPSREVVRAVAPEWLDFQAFTPDGLSLLYTRVGLNTGNQLFRVPVSGGEALDMHMIKPMTPNPISVSPDGRRIAYVEQTKRQDLRILPLNLIAQESAR